MRFSEVRWVRYVGLAAVCVGLAALVHVRQVHGAMHDAHDMGAHMTMTELRPVQPGDKDRADAIVVAARKFADRYTDYKKALADGYVIFHPEIKQGVYHFTDNAYARNTLVFDAARPASLLYERTTAAKAGGEPGYRLVGVMYTAPFRATTEELNRRVPLSIAQWHLHSNLCLPPGGSKQGEVLGQSAKFGLQGSITTAAACQAAGGTFLPHVFGWMVHVYPYETDPAKVWAAGMDDEHGMEKDAMPMGMDM